MMEDENWQSEVETMDGNIVFEAENGTYLKLMIGTRSYKKIITYLTRRQVFELQEALQAWIEVDDWK